MNYLSSLNSWDTRKYCGLPGADGWDDLFGSMNNITVKRYAQIYVHPQDIDLWSGGVSERPLPGAMVGPTFACIIATQFSNARRGDRFWYELGGLPHSFTLDQLSELRKARLARIVCDNTDIIDTIQLYPMVLPDHEINPRVPCRSGVLLNIDLSKWADYGGTSYSHQAPVHVQAPRGRVVVPQVPETVVANLLPTHQPLSSNRVVDNANLNGYENDPSVGKYVNQDGLQQLRHYLKVGPYRNSFHSHHHHDENPFHGYLRQVLTRRPVNYIHSTKGHDASNIANVHYSPHPEHEEHPAPGVDHSPRGFPIHPPSLEKVKSDGGYAHLSEHVPVNKPQYGPPIKSTAGGSKFHAGFNIELNAVLNPSPYGPPGGALGAPLGYTAPSVPVLTHHHHGEPIPVVAPVIPVAPAAPPTTYGSNLGRHYGAPSLPFGAGPLSLHYGFKPVSTPYGNVSLGNGKRYGQDIPQYVIDELQAVYSKDSYKRSPVVVATPSPLLIYHHIRRRDIDANDRTDRVAEGSIDVTTSSEAPAVVVVQQEKGNLNFTSTRTNSSSTNSSNSSNSSSAGHSPEELAGMRETVVNAAYDLFHGLTDLSWELIHRIRHTAEKVLPLPLSMTNSGTPPSTTPPQTSSSTDKLKNVNSSLNNLDSQIPIEAESSIGTHRVNPKQEVPPSSSSPNINPLRIIIPPSFTQNPRHQVLVRKATSFVTSVLKDVSQELNRRIQNS
ncbi:unnamed protein product [Allacma fusca]|uniref:Uncharacterized protein n=1 Tax=Allacma fusca TaxID=39272 RepID=A0A8J2KDQ5_9HEXA|nr:unnamed protein product [Allacma fusca]